jgi:ribosomal protein S18 acetylase RimI-like enzyme
MTELRPLTESDIPAWNRLLAQIEEVDRTGEHYNEADLLEEMRNPDLTPGQDMVGAWDPASGELVGYFCIYHRPASDGLHKIHLEGATRPDLRGQGIGTRLAEAMMRRAEQVHLEQAADVPVLYSLSGVSANTAQADLMAGVGLRPERWSFVMRAQLENVPRPRPVPGRLQIRRYDDGMADLMHRTHNEVFVDHPNFTPWTDAMWKQWVTESRNFRPGLSFVVVDPARPDELAAYVQTNEYDAYFAATGRKEAYVGKVGTRREYRGQGVATALLQHCLEAYRAAGFDEASLDVDSENPTGALGVYERAGFEVELRRTDYTRRA